MHKEVALRKSYLTKSSNLSSPKSLLLVKKNDKAKNVIYVHKTNMKGNFHRTTLSLGLVSWMLSLVYESKWFLILHSRVILCFFAIGISAHLRLYPCHGLCSYCYYAEMENIKIYLHVNLDKQFSLSFSFSFSVGG